MAQRVEVVGEALQHRVRVQGDIGAYLAEESFLAQIGTIGSGWCGLLYLGTGLGMMMVSR